MVWTAGIIASTLVLGLTAILIRLLRTRNSIFANVLLGVVASVSLLLLLAATDRDMLLLAAPEAFFALLWGGFAGLLWYFLKRWLVLPAGLTRG